MENQGLDITEKQYRDLPYISYSFLSGLSKSGPHITNTEEKDGNATRLGQLVEDMLFGKHDRNQYYIGVMQEVGDTLKYAIDEIFAITNHFPENPEEREKLIIYVLDGNLGIPYYSDRGSIKRAKDICEKGKSYMDYLMHSKGRIPIHPGIYEKAMELSKILKNHRFTKHIFETETYQQSFVQFKNIFDYMGLTIKFMMDYVKVDHKEKIVWLYDLKTGEKKTEKFQESYHFWRYDIQDYIYTRGGREIFSSMFPGYRVEPMRFIYISTEGYPKPLIYKGFGEHEIIRKGYYRHGKFYKGIDALIEDYKWYLQNSFNVEYPKRIYDVDGVVSLNPEGIKIRE